MNEFESLKRQLAEVERKKYELEQENDELRKKISLLQGEVNRLNEVVSDYGWQQDYNRNVDYYDSFYMKEQGW